MVQISSREIRENPLLKKKTGTNFLHYFTKSSTWFISCRPGSASCSNSYCFISWAQSDLAVPFLMQSLFSSDRVPMVVAGGPFCDHPSGPQEYFLTKLPTEIQFLGSRPAEIHVFVNNFALREVCTVSLSCHYCSSTLRYVRQVLLSTKKNKLTSSRSLPTADCRPWRLAAGFQQQKWIKKI
jgi:hypothetical protein